MTLDQIDADLDADRIAPRAALRLCRRALEELEGRSLRAIAARLGVPTATVAWIEARAIRKLKSGWRFDPETGQAYRPVAQMLRPGLAKA